MEIVSHQEIGDKPWDSFCDASPEAWLRHTSRGRAGALALDAGNEDHSFGVMSDGVLVAVAPLITQPLLENGGREFAFSINTRPTDTHSLPTPAPAASSLLAFALCMEEIDRRAKKHNITRVRMFIDPLAQVPAQNPLLDFGYKDASTTTSIIDLRQSEGVLLSRMSKGHRSDITFAQKQDYEVSVYSDAAGLHASLNFEGKNIAHVLALTYKQCAYYGKSKMEPEARALRGAGQLLQWRIMLELKRQGFEHYDMGWQSGSTPKEAAIASFKRHFGGDSVPLLMGIKTY